MENYVEETVTTQRSDVAPAPSNPTEKKVSSTQTIQSVVYFFFGIVDIFLAFRLVLKLLGANPSSDFVKFIYNLSGIFTAPFEGIFRSGYTKGVETTSVLEPSTVVAFIVYIVLAWGIVKLVQVMSGKQEASS